MKCQKCQEIKRKEHFPQARDSSFEGWCRSCRRKATVNRSNEKRRSLQKLHKLCACGEPLTDGFKTCAVCRQKTRDKTRKRRATPEGREQSRKHNQRSYAKLKAEMYEAYGGALCQCCGESHEEFLTIDHIEPVGASPHKTRCGVGLYRWLKKHGFPAGFRVLCMNCNFAMGQYGYCPHHGLPDSAPK